MHELSPRFNVVRGKPIISHRCDSLDLRHPVPVVQIRLGRKANELTISRDSQSGPRGGPLANVCCLFAIVGASLELEISCHSGGVLMCMALPTSYLTSFKNVDAILNSMQNAQAPDRFTVKFLNELGYTGTADRLVIKMLKELAFLSDGNEPQQRYFEFLDESESERVMGEALREAYTDLFLINRNAHQMSVEEIRAKFKTISQGQYSNDVLGKMARTFAAFASNATFDSKLAEQQIEEVSPSVVAPEQQPLPRAATEGGRIGLVYEINIHLPATRDAAVYDALFGSLTRHLDV